MMVVVIPIVIVHDDHFTTHVLASVRVLGACVHPTAGERGRE